ncbi:hypothetical protein ACX9MO_13365 [Pseudooceanicola sp. 502str34]
MLDLALNPDRDWLLWQGAVNDDQPSAARPGAGRGDRQHEAEPYISIDSRDLSEPFTAPWFERPSLWGVLLPVNSEDFAEDDPSRLAGSGPLPVATAMILGSEALETHPLREVRELGGRLRQYIEGEHYREMTLDRFIGFRVSGMRPFDYREKVARRDALVVALAANEMYADLGCSSTAEAIRKGFDGYFTDVWQRRKDTAPIPTKEPKLTFWRIAQIGLTAPMPNVQTITGMIRKVRGLD